MKQFAFILSLVLCLSTMTLAQNTSRADELMQQAQTNLKQKEYIKPVTFSCKLTMLSLHKRSTTRL
jgi:hypothetical protein